MISRYQYIVTFLSLRDSIAVQIAALAAFLLSPALTLRLFPAGRRFASWHIWLLILIVYGLAAAGVLHDLYLGY